MMQFACARPLRKRKNRLSDDELPTPPSEEQLWNSIAATSSPPEKRRRTSHANSPPLSTETSIDETKTNPMLDQAINVLNTEALALAQVAELYTTSEIARESLASVVNAIVSAYHTRNKLVVCGVGKSAYIGQKLVATLKSLGARSSYMHACEAAHGDLGNVEKGDIVLFMSFSGRTPELLNLMPHLPDDILIVALSGQVEKSACQLLGCREGSILLPAPIPESEETSFGVGAPTTSTTVALAVADMLALTVASQIHGDSKQQIFKRNHPGGAIGMKHREVEELKKKHVDVSILELPSPEISGEDDR